MKVKFAVDPGASGGVAVWAFGKTFCHPMPATEGDRLELIRDLARLAKVESLPHGPSVNCLCVLEQVGGFVGKGQPGSAMFKFGEHFGFLKGVVQALGIRLVLVRPQVWQKSFGLGTASSCASKTAWKNKLKAEAQRRFPHLAVTLATADALLILDWALHQRDGAGEPVASVTLDPTGELLGARGRRSEVRGQTESATSPRPNDSLAPARSALGGPSPMANSFRRFPIDSSPPKAERGKNGGRTDGAARRPYLSLPHPRTALWRDFPAKF